MIITKIAKVKEQVVSKVLCNMCGKSIKPMETGTICPKVFEFAQLYATWGYGSGHDMESFRLEICEVCVYNTLLPMCKIQPEITESL